VSPPPSLSNPSVTKKKSKNTFLDGKSKEGVLFVYPFAEDATTIEEAASGRAEFPTKSVDGKQISKESPESLSENRRRRSHYVTITVEAYLRLDPKVWLNDSLVDFFMLWISRDIKNIHAYICDRWKEGDQEGHTVLEDIDDTSHDPKPVDSETKPETTLSERPTAKLITKSSRSLMHP